MCHSASTSLHTLRSSRNLNHSATCKLILNLHVFTIHRENNDIARGQIDMPLGLAGRGKGYDHASFRSLPFNEQLARISLQTINPGPDGVASMSQCQCNMAIHEISGYESHPPTTPKYLSNHLLTS